MNLIRIALAVLLLAVCAPAADVPDDFKCGPIDCDTLKDHPNARYDAIDEKLKNGQQIDVDHIDALRQKFWETYPDKQGHKEARELFAQALFEKDLLFLQAGMTKRLFEATSDASGVRGTQMLADLMDAAFSSGIDGGIPKSAQGEFADWVKAVNQSFGPIQGTDQIAIKGFQTGLGLLSGSVRRASNPGGKEYQAYLIERDWAEFDRAKVIPGAFDNQKKYGQFLYFRFAKLPYDYAAAVYESMTNALGRDVVEAAAEKVRVAPKTEGGNLVKNVPKPVKRGPGGEEVDDYEFPMPPGVIGVYSNQLVAMEILATQDDAHRYLLFVLKGQFKLDREHLDPAVNKWVFAQNVSDGLEKAFGKEALQEAAEKVRSATKGMVAGNVINPKAIGATRGEPYSSLEDILARANPKGYVRMMLAYNKNPASPASVDMDAAYKQFAAANESAVLEAAKRMAGDKPNLAYRLEIESLKHLISAGPAAEKPAAEMVDCPEYVAWKKLKPGAKVTYAERAWNPDKPGSDRLIPTYFMNRQSFQLQSVNDEGCKLWLTSQVFDGSGAAHPPRDSEIGYPAKWPKSTPPGVGLGANRRVIKPADVKESGEETLVIAGRKIATHWTSVTTSYGQPEMGLTTTITKTWTNDEIPGRLIRMTEDQTWPGPRGMQHGMHEKYLESFEGLTLGEPAGDAAPAAGTIVPMVRPNAAPNQPAPVPVPAAPSAPAPPAPAAPKADSAIAARNQMMQRFQHVMGRAGIAQVQLNQRDASKLPPDIRAARDRLTGEIQAAIGALNKRASDADLESKFKTLEETTTVIEKYLQK